VADFELAEAFLPINDVGCSVGNSPPPKDGMVRMTVRSGGGIVTDGSVSDESRTPWP